MGRWVGGWKGGREGGGREGGREDWLAGGMDTLKSLPPKYNTAPPFKTTYLHEGAEPSSYT